jgi:flagellin FlaB
MGIYKKLLVEHSTFGSIGIGALIVFIAVVLVAGIAATVLIQTSSTLEIQASTTGRETTSEVNTGLEICSIEGYAASGADMSKLIIMVRPRAGSEDINLKNAYIELSDTNKKVILNYSTSFYLEAAEGINDVFSANIFPDDDFAYGSPSNTDGSQYGILIIEDGDESSSKTSPIINRGDKAYLCINTTGTFNNIAENSDIWGMIVPEDGYGGIINFRTPNTYTKNVMEFS